MFHIFLKITLSQSNEYWPQQKSFHNSQLTTSQRWQEFLEWTLSEPFIQPLTNLYMSTSILSPASSTRTLTPVGTNIAVLSAARIIFIDPIFDYTKLDRTRSPTADK